MAKPKIQEVVEEGRKFIGRVRYRGWEGNVPLRKTSPDFNGTGRVSMDQADDGMHCSGFINASRRNAGLPGKSGTEEYGTFLANLRPYRPGEGRLPFGKVLFWPFKSGSRQGHIGIATDVIDGRQRVLQCDAFGDGQTMPGVNETRSVLETYNLMHHEGQAHVGDFPDAPSTGTLHENPAGGLLPDPTDEVKLSPNRWPGWPSYGQSGVTIHTMEGYFDPSVAGFLTYDPKNGASAHWCIRRDGHILQMVWERDRAWHALAASRYYFGIEHEGSGFPGDPQINPSRVPCYWTTPHALGALPQQRRDEHVQQRDLLIAIRQLVSEVLEQLLVEDRRLPVVNKAGGGTSPTLDIASFLLV